MSTAREILARIDLSPSEGAGADLLKEYRRVRDRTALTKRHAATLRKVRRDLAAVAERLDIAIRRGDGCEIGNVLLGARQVVRASSSVIDALARKDKAPSLRLDFVWPLHIADRQLLDHEVAIATARPPALGFDGGPPQDDGLAALHVAIQTLDNHLARRGHPPDHATHLLLLMVADLRVPRDKVPEVAAALLIEARETKERMRPLVKRLETVQSRHPMNL